MKLYWDASAGAVTTTGAGNTLIGFAAAGAASAAVTGDVLLTGQAV